MVPASLCAVSQVVWLTLFLLLQAAAAASSAGGSGGSEGSAEDESDDEESSDSSESEDDGDNEDKEEEEKEEEEEEEEESQPLSLEWPETRRKQATYLFLLPIVFPLWLTLPDVRNLVNSPHHHYHYDLWP